MKLKYYLRGVGTGVVVTTLILMIAFAFYRPKMSDEDIIARARQLGMEEKEDETTKGPSPSKTDEQKDEGKTEPESGEQPVEKVSVTILPGETSAVIAQHLEELGLVDNAKAFDMFISDQDLDNDLLTGTHEVPKNSTFLEIAEILTTKEP